jgi:hypothetical protein
MEGFVACKDGCARAVFDGFRKDAVAVIIVEDQQVVIAVTGWRNEAACLVSVDLAGGLHECCVAEVGALIVWWIGVIIHSIAWWLEGRGVGRTCGALVLARLIKVAFDHGEGARWVLSEESGRKAGEVSDETFVKSKV